MLITDQTKYSELAHVEKYLTEQAVRELYNAAEVKFGSMYDLTFAQFHACANGNYSEIVGDMTDATVLQIYWCKRFGEFVKEFAETLSKITLTQTPDEKRACTGLLKTDWAEGLLVFIRDYFGLQSFKAAENITLGEVLIAKRAQYNNDLFRRNLARIQTQKIKNRK